ncbi:MULTISPECIES: Ger(x)C family spore germination protein [unclassified Paenibacillus]|uniref:Ger(x)C family spore germination protein n=1 Tax=unclassified Paenibacillus TaxID=185978 RepID=UPI001C0F5CBB|nr:MULTISPECIES: Ger(x)C family spore germination protein [unclassified Paenibacillus]MBU5443219.1 Ger(x)C family spore germination protein [Paenibacillus sp. MSJ-34]CAH0121381.1 Spore germination protein A3 [Paenibacillus sp. CECT 9249]
MQYERGTAQKYVLPSFSNMPRKAPFRAALLCIVTSLFLTGCWDRTELNDLAIITATAIDITDNNQVKLAVQIYVSKQGQASGGSQTQLEQQSSSGGPQNTVVIAAKGISLADAAANLQEQLPRKVFWGHNKVFIFGEKTVKAGIKDHIDFLLRHPGTREHSYVFASKGDAMKILDMNTVLERDSSEVLREMTKNRTGLTVTLNEIMQLLNEKSEAAFLPRIELRDRDGKGKVPTIRGTDVLEEGKYAGWIDRTATRGVMWLRDEIKTSIITVDSEQEKGLISFRLAHNKTDLVPLVRGNEWSITAKIEMEGDIVQNTSEQDITKVEQVKLAERAIGDDVRKRIELALRIAQDELDADIFGFAKEFRRKYPMEWEKNERRWKEIFPQIRVNVEPKVKVLRIGMVGKNMENMKETDQVE